MKKKPLIAATCAVIVFILFFWAVPTLVRIGMASQLKRLSGVEGGATAYRVRPYLRAVARLQSEGRDRACQEMLADATNGVTTDQTYILCRMLFVPRSGSNFRRAAILVPFFFGGTEIGDWPLQPVEIIDGVPFFIVYYYSGFGAYESQKHYLLYCMTNCDWNPTRFYEKTDNEMDDALAKLLKSPKWKRALTPKELTILSDQIK